MITDKRKIDRPMSRKPGGQGAGSSAPEKGAEPPAAESAQVPMVEAALLDERTADLQRLQADYANYRRRSERERQAAGELALGRALADFLPVLDDIDRARQHDDLTGGLKAIADRLEGILSKLGLVAFGEVGDPFDPTIHDAVMHDESADVSEPTCTTVMRPGYKHNDRLLRPAMVGVSDPATPDPVEPTEPEAHDE
ncbi:MAG TPA: nucleotide exchange factor GrpE [Jatrophihabitans sp.]